MTSPLRRRLAAWTLLAGVGLAAQAQTAPAAPAAPGTAPTREARHHDPARMAERVNRHLADLKQKLQLSPNQEPAWTSFSTALQPPAMPPRPDLAALPTPDRLDQLRARRDQRNAEMDRRAEATKAFYATLSAEQKAVFDRETARLFQPHRGPGGMHHHG